MKLMSSRWNLASLGRSGCVFQAVLDVSVCLEIKHLSGYVFQCSENKLLVFFSMVTKSFQESTS